MFFASLLCAVALTPKLTGGWLLQGRAAVPGLPYAENTAKGCTWWYDSNGGDSCVDVPKLFRISLSQFVEWNPSITADCGNFKTGRSYCVEVALATTTSQPTSTATPVGPVNGIETPQPTQPKITQNCNRFHLVQPGESCVDVARRNGISQVDMTAWNPSANSDCNGLRAYAYACTSVLEQFNFGSYKFAGWTIVDGDFRLNKGAIETGVTEGGKALVDTTYTDISMTMVVIFKSDDTTTGHIGLMFRASDIGVGADNYRGYYVGIDRAGGGIVIGRSDKKWTQLRFVSATISAFAALKVEMTGDLISVYFGDLNRPLTTLRDTMYRQGQVGIRAYRKAATVAAFLISPLVYDGFEQQLAGWTVYDGYFNASSGLLVSSNSEIAKATMNTEFANFTFDASIFPFKIDVGTAGVLFRTSNLAWGPNAYEGYYVGLGTDGRLILGRSDGKSWTELQSVKTNVKMFVMTRIRVRAVGPNIDVYFDDMAKPIISVADTSYSRGMVGARLDSSIAFFDNFIVQRK